MSARVPHRALTALALLAAAGRPAHAESVLGTPYAPTAGRPTVAAADHNPANAALLPGTTTATGIAAFETNVVSMRYPGSDPIVKSMSWTPNPLTIHGGTIYRVGPLGLGVTGIVPPVSAKVSLEDVAFVVLGQPNFVTIDTHVRVKGGANLVGAFALGKHTSIGFKVHYLALALDADVRSAETGAPLIGLKAEAEFMDSVVGARTQIGERLSLAVSTNLVGRTRQHATIISPLIGDDAEGPLRDGLELAKTDLPLSRVFIGFGLALTRSIRLVGDAIYRRANKDATELSSVELREKPKDLYDSIGLAGGVDIELAGGKGVYVRGQYQPPHVGRGGRGPDSKAGFGMVEVMGIYLGKDDLTPYTAAEAGVRIAWGRHKWWRALELSAGTRYQYASLGINETGELPAAYTQTRTSFPFSLTMRP